MTDEEKTEKTEIIEDFISNLMENMTDADPEFSKVVDDHFWELT